jgi:hypothetical protein
MHRLSVVQPQILELDLAAGLQGPKQIDHFTLRRVIFK